MKRIHNLVGKPYKTIQAVNGTSYLRIETGNAQREGGAVPLGDQSAYVERQVLYSGSIFYLLKYLHASPAAILPEIIAGGTPGPGTVSCPV